MDRFAFLACQPYLLPPHRTDDGAARDTRARRSAVARSRDTAGGPTDKSHDAPCGVHRSGASSFACCASFHFSQAEQYAPSVSPDAKGSPTGAWERPDIVGAATDDALHLAFARTDSNPDQAQLTCELTVRERHSSSSSPPPPGGCVDVILDGARFELDMRQCRAVVEGFPPGNSSDEGSECRSMKHNDDDDDDATRPPPYVSCVFSHVTLNLYRPRGTTGGRRRGTPCARCAARWSAPGPSRGQIGNRTFPRRRMSGNRDGRTGRLPRSGASAPASSATRCSGWCPSGRKGAR